MTTPAEVRISSRDRMLGRAGYFGWHCSLTGRPGPKRRWKHRVERHREARYLRASLVPETDLDWLVSLTPWLYDLSDCRHGCNGQCLESGSERCDFTCHEGMDPAQLRGSA